MQRFFISLLLLLLLGGCGVSNSLVDPQADTSGILNSDLAYVLLGYDTEFDVGSTYTSWQHSSLRYNETAAPNQRAAFSTSFMPGTDYYFLELVPGTYSLVYCEWSTSRRSIYMNPAAQEQNELLKDKGGLFGSFTAEKGKITYIGNLNFTFLHEKERFNLAVEDKRNEALDYLRKSYPKISPDKLFNVRLTQPGPGTK